MRADHSDARLASEDARDWHEYECAHGHRWWSAPTSTRCPVCNTSTYTPGAVTFAALPSTSGPSEDALCDETENCPSEDWHYWRCPKYDGKALPSPSGWFFFVYAITFDQETFGIFATRKAAEESLAQQIAEGGPAWSDCNVEQWRVRGIPEIGAGGTENT